MRFVIVNIYREMAIRGHSKVMYFVSQWKDDKALNNII